MWGNDLLGGRLHAPGSTSETFSKTLRHVLTTHTENSFGLLKVKLL